MRNRRAVLTAGLSALALAAPFPAWATDPVAGAVARWRRMLIGEGAGDAKLAAILDAIDAEAARLQGLMILSGRRDALWADLIGGDERRTTSSLQRLRLMSIAHQTPGSAHYGSESLGAAIRSALHWISGERYFAGADKRGNWWDWEIGSPLRLLDVLVLMRPHLPAALVDDLLGAVEHFAPTPGILHQSGFPAPATGANLAWISSVRAGRSLLRGDPLGVQRARDAILPALRFSRSGDGFYADGSFIQHGDIASTGAYGAAFTFLVADFASLLVGSPWALTRQDLAPMNQWVDAGVLPLMHKGGCMDMVRSRSITRADVQDQETGLVFLLALCRLSELGEKDQADRLRGFIKHTVEADTALSLFDIDIDAPGFQMTLDHARIAAAIVNDPGTPSTLPAPRHFQFAGMDRVVHRRAGFTFGIAMYSDRVANYEAINGQNKRGWYTGHGMTYIYNDDLQHYRNGFWPTVDALRLPGVTSDQRPTTHQLRSPEAWVGGAALDEHGAVGMKVSFNDGPTRATKSWFCFGDQIICLGSGIEGRGGVTLETTIENRRLSEGLSSGQLSADGGRSLTQGQATDLSEARWLHLPEAGGILLGVGQAHQPHGMAVRGLLEARVGAWHDVDVLNPEGPPFSRDFATVWIDHGQDPTDGAYAYVLLPGADEAATRRQSEEGRLRVVARDAIAHAVHDPDQGLFAANIWSGDGAVVGPLRTFSPCSVIVQSTGTALKIAVSDPTHLQGLVRLAVRAPGARLLKADERSRVRIDGDTAFITVDTAGAAGVSVGVELAVDGDFSFDP